MNYEEIVESFIEGKLSHDETLLALKKLGIDSLLDFFWRVDSTIFKNTEIINDFHSNRKYCELDYLITLKNAESSRSDILCYKFNDFASSEYVSQNIRHYGLFMPLGLSLLVNIKEYLQISLPTINLESIFPEIKRINKSQRDLLINLHQLSILNRSSPQKKSLTLVDEVLLISNEDVSRSIEIDFCFNQLIANIDNHWHQTTLFCYLELVDFAIRSGYSITPMFKHIFSPSPATSPSKFYITQHTTSSPQINRIHFKNSHLSGYIHFDHIGYAGFSSLGASNLEIKLCDDAYIKEHILMVRSRYDDATLAKHPQNLIDFDIDKYKSVYRRIILFTMQLPFDSVQRLAYIKTRDLLMALCECIGSDDLLLVKRHPYDDTEETNLLLERLTAYKNIVVTDASIYSLFKISDLLVTVNSGTGFEAAIYGLDVVTAGVSDYSPATRLVKNFEELRNALSMNRFPTAIERNRYLYAYLKEMYCIYDSELDRSHLFFNLLGSLKS